MPDKCPVCNGPLMEDSDTRWCKSLGCWAERVVEPESDPDTDTGDTTGDDPESDSGELDTGDTSPEEPQE